MNPTPDAAATGNGGSFGPEQAAALLDQATQQARRKFAPSPPWLLATRAVAVLAVCGAAWLSVRGQHPYRGPTAAVIPVLVVFIILNFAATVGVRERAVAGIRGVTRFRPAEIIVMVVAWASVPVLIWVLAANGTSLAEYPTTVLIVPGLAWAGVMAARAGWRGCGTGLAVAVVGLAGAFAGPAGSWLVAGVGLCAVLMGRAVAIAWRQRG
ncbi:MAG TPA: hypothetical protein VMI33_21320 [Streptosporangiaceae bacterium]|nr:hypothetical protein [Streptosporangiaceae bacterium]